MKTHSGSCVTSKRALRCASLTFFPSHQLCPWRVVWLETTSLTKDLSNILLHALPSPRQKRTRMHFRKSSERTDASFHIQPPFQHKFRRHCVLAHLVSEKLCCESPGPIGHTEMVRDKIGTLFTYFGCSNLSIRSTFSTRSPPTVRTMS